MGRLDGKVCFVTGAGSGIGAKTAELFAHEGASVIMADMHEENLNKVAANIRAAGGEVMTAVVNITDNDAVKAAFAAGVEKYGKIDALANIAGVLDVAMRPIDDFLTSDLDTTLTVNVKGTMYVTRAAVKQFIAQGYGTIATVASVGGVNGNGSAAYTVSKGAEVALTKHIALRFANGEQKIRANCVCPGTVMTPMTTRHEGQRQVHEGRQGHAGLHRKAFHARRGHVLGSRHCQDPAVFVQRRFCAAQRSGARCRLRRKPLSNLGAAAPITGNNMTTIRKEVYGYE